MNRLLKTWTPILFMATSVTACFEDVEKADVDELSNYAKNYVSMRLGGAASRNALSSNIGPGNPANESFQRIYSNFNGFSTGGRIAGDSTNSSEGGLKVILQ
ncbi:MAG: hypothetical protein U5K79_14755 [Cyclobacteriaceae bacterium]|nr:hypothetical protein [Cyclobacteriaceae bacterium]